MMIQSDELHHFFRGVGLNHQLAIDEPWIYTLLTTINIQLTIIRN